MSVATYLPSPGIGASGTIVSGKALSNSASLPVIVKADLVQLGVGNPTIPRKLAPDEEIALLRRRVRLLEGEIKKALGALAREKERAEHGTTKRDLERQIAVWNRAKEQMQQEHLAELVRVRDECRSQLEANTRDWDKRLRTSAHDVSVSSEARLEALKATLDARAEEQAERAKEERISLLRRQSARRMMNAGLSSAWSAWCELWEAKTYAVSKLREVANRLRKPEMSVAFSYLVRHRETSVRMALARAAIKKEESLTSVRDELETEIARLTADYERRLATAEDTKRKALEQQKVELLGTSAQQAELRATKEREERVERLRRQSMRRVLNADLANGWSAWVELWEAKSYALTRLREVGNKLRSPEMAFGFGLWAAAWRLTQQRKADRAARKNDSLLYAAQARCDAMEAEMARLRDEIQQGADERQRLCQRVAELDGGAEEAERLYEEQRAKEKQGRIEMLRKQAVRRVLASGLSRGFSAWCECYEARRYALERLRQVGNRLHTPFLTLSFEFWSTEAASAKQEAERLSWARKEHDMHGKVATLGAELQRVRAECEQRLADAAREHDRQLERLKMEMSGDYDESAKAREGAEKEARVELLRRQIGRRILNQSLTRGWAAWVGFWATKAQAMRTLRRVAAKLQRPDVAFAFDVWLMVMIEQQRQVEAIRRRNQSAKLEEELTLLRGQLQSILEDQERERREAEVDRMQLVQQIALLGGGAAEAAALREAQAEKDKEERVALCRRQAMRRMLHRDLSIGFAAWTELAEAKAYALERLRTCASRLRTPELADAFGTWAEVWYDQRQRASMVTYKEQAAQHAKERDRLAAELRKATAEFEAKLALAEEQKQLALHRQRVELCGSAEELASLREQKERDARVEMLRRQASRRMLNGSLAAAWRAWTELWEARSYALSRLIEVGNRLRAPELSGAWTFWQGASAAAKAEGERARLEREANSFEAQLRRARYEAGQLELIRVAHDDEVNALRDRVTEMSEEIKANTAELAAAAEMRLKHDAVQEAAARSAEAAETAERLKRESEEDAIAQRLSAQKLLERLLVEQRASFDEERERMMREHGLGAEHRASIESTYEEERQRVKEEVSRLVTELQGSRDELSKQGRELTNAREQLKRLEGQLEGSKASCLRLERELKDERAKPKAAKSPPREKEKPVKKGSSALGKIDLDEGPDAPPITQQIAAALRHNAGKVMDLFREWDQDGDGEVSKKEFRKAMPAIGLEVPVKEVDALFDSWDKDGGGSLNYKELSKILRSEAKQLNQQGGHAVTQTKNAATAMSAVSKLKKGVAKPPGVVTPPP